MLLIAGGVEVEHFLKRGPELILKYSGLEPPEDKKRGKWHEEMVYRTLDFIEFASGSDG